MSDKVSFIVRVDPRIHSQLKRQALNSNLSLNRLCQRLLERGASQASIVANQSGQEFSTIMDRARELFAQDLIGVIAFGSYVRGEATPSSDVDILFILDSKRKLDRSLYTEWSSRVGDSDTIGGLPVSVHFVNLPPTSDKCSGLWLEVALEGIVIFDPGWSVSRFLIGVRRRIEQGEVSSKRLHGQRYWVWNKEAA